MDYLNKILCLKNIKREEILTIVEQETDKLYLVVDDVSCFCKYLANQIKVSLQEIGIKSWYLDLNDIVEVDHVVLISEYKDNGIVKQVLIDPTFI